VQIVENLVTVVRPERNRLRQFLTNFKNFPHHREHIHVAGKVVILKEVAVIIALHVAKVNEVDPFSRLPDNADEVVFWTGSQRSGTEA
jgi:hypothetical protein